MSADDRLREIRASHAGTLEHRETAAGVEFRAVCACDWVSVWRTTNACMGNHRRHVSALLSAARKAAQ